MSENTEKNPSVSVFTPSYNNSKYIQTTLRSMFAQTYRNIVELTVIDDGSTDDSVKIIEKELKDCPFKCELVVRPNKGVSNTINEGIEKSCGEYFASTASDDVWLPDSIERLVRQLQNRPDAVLAYGHCYYIDENDLIIGSSADFAEFVDGDAREMLLTKYPPFGGATLFRKTALNIHKFNPNIFVEDFELYLRLSSLGAFALEPTVLAAYRTHPANASNKTTALIDSKIEAFEINAEILGLSQKELSEIITRVKWDSVDFLLDSGQRFDAIKLALQNSRVKLPVTSKLKQYLKLLLPKVVLEAGRQSIKRNDFHDKGIDIKTLIFGQEGERRARKFVP